MACLPCVYWDSLQEKNLGIFNLASVELKAFLAHTLTSSTQLPEMLTPGAGYENTEPLLCV